MFADKQPRTTSVPAFISQSNFQGGGGVMRWGRSPPQFNCNLRDPRVQVQVQSQATMAPDRELPTHKFLPRVNYCNCRLGRDKSNTTSIEASFKGMSFHVYVCVRGASGVDFCYITNTFAASVFLDVSFSLCFSLSGYNYANSMYIAVTPKAWGVLKAPRSFSPVTVLGSY